ncbi:hypothetical protein Ga0100231_012210 [Opitutaceae bacterium TAV4]|nr:hypothetical protein Ga0100231_012210 [Opitutaceae bacterium TAV4]RRK02105.1 hypothetical protein Ga0100230_002570 [Opitutaceae bacterium TAV3]
MKSTRKLLTPVLAFSLLAFSFSAASAVAADAAAPSESVTVNILRLLVQQGVFTPEQAEGLVRQAEAEAAAAKETARLAAIAHAPGGAATSGSAASAGLAPVTTTTADGAVRVTYVPEVVKQQLREDIKQDVMRQAREENWADPREVPAWTKKLRLTGDVRFRYEGDSFPDDNAVGPGYNPFYNFNSINRGSPFDISPLNTTTEPPTYNADQDRDRLRLRARLALDADLGENFSAGLRIATGNDSSPVSTNQTMGSDGLGAKYALWLDRAFLNYNIPGLTSDKQIALTVGRFNTPFFSTDLIWDDDLGFDGIMAQARYGIGQRITPFFTLGAFPVYNTDFNFSSNQPQKFKSEDKWLYGGQLGFDWKLTDDLSVKVGVAYYDFVNVEGKISSSYIPLNASDPGNTDGSRPAFAQRGNTYVPLREIPEYYPGTTTLNNEWQYFGLATPFRELAFTARVDFKRFDPVHIFLETEFVQNLAFDEAAINANGPSRHKGPTNNLDDDDRFEGGDIGYLVRLNVGQPVLEKRWDWQASIAYKYVESDAVVDGFTDSDFGLGGTNLKGYILGLTVGLAKNVNGRLRWLSADSIAGPPYSADVFQFDINARF